MRVLKVFFIICFGFVSLAGCSPKEPKNDGSSANQDSLNTGGLTKKSIIGTWENCKSEIGDEKVTATSCRIIQFNDDNSGVITHGDLTRENIAWAIVGEDLRIDLVDARTDSMFFAFTDTLYRATFTNDTLHPALELTAKHKRIIYHLSK